MARRAYSTSKQAETAAFGMSLNLTLALLAADAR